ncbi:MAG TPA: hypothetical protein VFR59_08915 [Steroidobacteraceae bacterium]|nr:hypothetical protein [Steroidobacteraceae bacterium]
MRYLRWLHLPMLALALTTAAHAQTNFDTYRVARMDEVVGPNIVISDVNAQGEMVGSQRLDSGQIRAVLVRDGMVINLDDLMGGASPHTNAVAINDFAQVAGISVIQDASGNLVGPAVLWEGGQIRDLGISGIVTDLNNRGQVIGDTQVVGETDRPFLWENGRTTFLELLMDCLPFTIAHALAINDNGVIVGEVNFRAVMWRNGEVMPLGPIEPKTTSRAVDVNDRDEVIVNFHFFDHQEPGDITEVKTAVLLHDGGEIFLPPDRAESASAVSINNNSQVVGHSSVHGNQGGPRFDRATIWQEGRVATLDELISDDDPRKGLLTLTFATKIFDSGLIIARGEDGASYFLTPTGVPATVAQPPAPLPSSPDNGSGGGADSGGGSVDLLSVLFLMLGLARFARSRRRHCVGAFG